MLGIFENWETKRYIVFFAPIALLVLGAIVCFLVRKTLWTRFRMASELAQDPEINEFLVVFNWTRKVLYMPTILASVAAALLVSLLKPELCQIVGGVWLGIFFVNFLIDEFQITIKVLVMILLVLGLLFLWLEFMDWVVPFLRFFGRLGVEISATVYLVIAFIFSTAVLVSWFRGLFNYVAITPNYMNLRTGPTENSEQVSHEEFRTRIDTGDFLERMLGFGQIVITFTDTRRPPIMLLVGRIGRRARMLESIRANLSVDLHRPSAPVEGAEKQS